MPTYIRLTDYKSSEEKEKGFFDPKNRYEAMQEDFEKIPGSPIAYWVKDTIKKSFDNNLLGATIPVKKGMDTGDNDKYLKLWFEPTFERIGIKLKSGKDTILLSKKWVPYNKGGEFRKWYGNKEYVINWENNGDKLKNSTANLRSQHLYFQDAITWNALTSNITSARLSDYGALFDSAGSSMFPDKNIYFYLAFMNTKIVDALLRIVNPTLNYGAGTVSNLPIIFPKSTEIKQKIDELTQQNIDISKEEWDSRETSWDFSTNPLLKVKSEELRVKSCRVEDAYNAYCNYWREKFFTLHRNEEELNRLFIEIYELQDELTPDVPLEDITILKNEAKIEGEELLFQADEIMKQFISYGVGVMFGRYSLDHEGLHIADMGVSLEEANARLHIQNPSFEADDDNVIPVVDEADYFADDMTERFERFVAVAFGQEYLHENIAFIENAIGKKLRKYFVKDFYKDHVKRYKKRPIYWMFSSPKGMFQTLIYMHRYTPDMLNEILNDYLRPFRIRLENMRSDLMRISESVDTVATERNLAERKIDKIDQTLDDINAYEKVLAHYAAQDIVIDLDDGVKVNYCKFKELTVPFDKKMCK